MTAADERIVLAAGAAALARRGWPAPNIAALLADAHPGGPVKERLAAVARKLALGEAAGEDALACLLERADGAPDALAELAIAERAALEARRAAETALAYPVVLGLLAALLLGMSAGGARIALLVELPHDWVALSVVCGAATVAGAILLASALVLLVLSTRDRSPLPGVRATRAAARCRLIAAGLKAGLPESAAWALAGAQVRGIGSARLLLNERERLLGVRLLESRPGAAALRALADELSAGARNHEEWLRILLPLAGFTGVAFLLVALLVVTTFPIWSPP